MKKNVQFKTSNKYLLLLLSIYRPTIVVGIRSVRYRGQPK